MSAMLCKLTRQDLFAKLGCFKGLAGALRSPAPGLDTESREHGRALSEKFCTGTIHEVMQLTQRDLHMIWTLALRAT